ncbi:hypothetical protein AB6A40_000561 [Gnathostoma spinigerum]|uniref:Sidekick n=1 Tax=Gnathostoma spinigerum TaxID=75299 RepID=A0ABD6EBJ1_9BILA
MGVQQWIITIYAVRIFSNVCSSVSLPTKPPHISAWSNSEVFIREGILYEVICPVDDPFTLESSILWYRNNKLLNITGQKLTFNAITHEQSGIYRCWATNHLGSTISSPLNITVLYIVGFHPFALSEVFIARGDSVVLQPPNLISSSQLNFTWTWFFNNEKIVKDNWHYVTKSGELVLLDYDGSSGVYQVEVSEESYRSTSDAITIFTELGGPRSLRMAILYKPRNAKVRIGDGIPAVFECVANHWSQSISLKWSIGGIQVLDDGFNLVISDYGRRFEIRTVDELNFQGSVLLVTCSLFVDNSLKDSAEANLTVIQKPKIDRAKIPPVVNLTLGGSVTVNCESTGFPDPSLRWYHNGQPMRLDATSLEVTGIGWNMSGVYQCEAFNEAGYDTAATWIKFSYGSSFGSRLLNQSIPLNGSVASSADTLTVEVGNDIFIPCGIKGSPRSAVLWEFNGSEIVGDDRHILQNQSLHIRTTAESDSGIYRCIVIDESVTDWQETTVHVSAGSELIEYGPKNQSILIGSNIVMPCQMSGYAASSNRALTVWKWNGQKLSNIVDPVHRLVVNSDGSISIKQVGPDNIGVYTCTVRAHGREQSASAWLKIIEKPSMPTSVVAELINETTRARVRLKWRAGFDGNSPLIKHIVEMRSVGPTNLWSDWEIVLDNLPLEICCVAFIDNLKPSSVVEFRVTAVNRYGSGKPSVPSNNITMPQQRPAAAPRSVVASARSWSSIMVQWQPPPADQWNGDIQGYLIRYRLANYASVPWLEKNITNGQIRNAPLEHLITWREYEIQVAAYSNRGMGVFSRPLYITTLEGVPTHPPSHLYVKVINSTAVAVSFTAPDQQVIPGVNQGYKVELWKKTVSPSSLYRQVRIPPNGPIINKTIDGLEKFGHYLVTVLCFTTPGDGPRSDPVEVTTDEDLPGAVDSLHFDLVLFNSVVVAWDPPSEPNGIITGYTLRYWEVSQPNEKYTVFANSSSRKVNIDGLKASTHYSIGIHARTKIGAGPETEAKFVSGVPPELPGSPSILFISNIGPRSAVIHFEPGFDGHTSIRTWIIEAEIASSTFSQIYNVSASGSSTLVVEGLRPFTEYRLRLLAKNIRGVGPPSEPSAPFKTDQSEPEIAPQRVIAEPLSPTSILVSWLPLLTAQWNGARGGYLIMYRSVSSNSFEIVSAWNEVRVSNIRSCDFILPDLEPFTTYEITMAAENNRGRSVSSNVVRARTYETFPSNGPSDVQVKSIDRRHVIVSWNEVQESSRGGIILGYQIDLEPENLELCNEHSCSITVDNPKVFLAEFAQLRPFTLYHVSIKAFTVAGIGPDYTSRVSFRTLEDIPSQPTNVSFSYIGETEVRLKWSPPEHPNGRILHYEVSYWTPYSKDDATKVKLPPHVLGFSTTGLLINSRYIFAVSAETASGQGPQTIVDVLTTFKRYPPPDAPAPHVDISYPQYPHSIVLRWDPIISSLESSVNWIRSYDVEYQTNDGSWTRWRHTIPGSETGVNITGLISNKEYRARIRVNTDFEQSGWSAESSWIKTSGSAPSMAPHSVRITSYNSTSVIVQWTQPEKTTWNSDLIGYRIKYKIYEQDQDYKYSEIAPTSIPSKEIERAIHGLNSLHHHIFQIISFNQYGSSNASLPIFIYVGYVIPKRLVTNLSAESPSSTSVFVSWDSWEYDPGLLISGFRVRYAPAIPAVRISDQDTQEMVVTDNNSVLLTELNKYSEYEVEVCAYNLAGEGNSSVVRIRTKEDLPSRVSSLSFSDILFDSVNVSWSPPHHPNGLIRAYHINYKVINSKDEFTEETREETPLTFLVAKGLKENATYVFSIKAETGAGLGEEMNGRVTLGPNPGCPSSPSKPHLMSGQASVTVQWRFDELAKLPIKGYVLQAMRISKNDDLGNDPLVNHRSERKHIIGAWFTVVVTNDDRTYYEVNYKLLEPSSLYVFRICARNLISIGFASEESDQFHVPALLPSVPFYTKWWFSALIAGIVSVVIILVVILLYVTGSKYNNSQKRSSTDLLQSVEPLGYEMQLSKKRSQPLRYDFPIHSVVRGSLVKMDASEITGTNVYSSLATDNVPVTSPGSVVGDSNPVYDEDVEIIEEDDIENRGINIGAWHEKDDPYRRTWRRVRAVAQAENQSPLVAQQPYRPDSSFSDRSNPTVISSTGGRSTVNGFSSFV